MPLDDKAITEPHVELLAYTVFEHPESEGPWLPWVQHSDIPEPIHQKGQGLIEFAGRACYQSWDNPKGRTNAEYIGNLLAQGHLSVIEHVSASFLIAGVSRSFTHELVRHRHLSFSQLSQRYVNEVEARYVVPEACRGDLEMEAILATAMAGAQGFYEELVERLTEKFRGIEDKTLRRKMARQAARAVLPNMTETQIVVTGNLRAWRHFLNMRGSRHAETEIRSVAVKVWELLQDVAPAVFGDYEQRPVKGSAVPELVTELQAE